MEGPSLLEQPVTLAEILDQDSLQRVCMTFSRLFGTGLAVADGRGQVLVDVPAEYGYCRRIAALPAGAKVCCSFDRLAHPSDPSGPRGTPDERCICGLNYALLPITHQGVLLGRLIYGPYRPEGLAELPSEVEELLRPDGTASDEGSRPALVAELGRLPTHPRSQVERNLGAVGEVLSVIVQNGYARHLTSQIHIAAIQDAYNELTEKNRRLADSVEKLKELDKLKSNFLATVSHELRTPLTSVIGYSEMLLEGLAGPLAPEQRDYVQTIMEKGDQLLQIISEILDISKIETGNVQLACERVDVADLLRQVSDAMMPQARRKGLLLQYEAAPALPMILADRAKTRQVLLNLVSNAVKFTTEGGEIRVSAATGELKLDQIAAGGLPAVEIRVRDTGVGVPPEARERIFEAFYQLDSSSTREFGGTGLGLSIVKHFVEAHGGKVWVEQPEGKGSIFVVQLPLRPPKGTPAEKGLRRGQLVG
ncbi:MAG: PocR ligand-binding domain-containing protein [Deltaproteobacteria bacterium]|nr:PocR ligand-binding domain-containing protein [Deltaproteobacteria bacterium]